MQFLSPVGEIVWPENALPGTIPAKNDFTLWPHLRDGVGLDVDGQL